MTGLLDAALAYAARGWPVFPCQPGLKIPATAHGVLDATTDPDQIRAWWTARPDANVAIATGHPGPDVIDIDVKPDGNGWDGLTRLTHAGLTDSRHYISTPSGGLHIYFQGTRQRNSTIRRQHIDFRGAGGYVLAPPSTVSGKPYTQAGQPPAPPGHADWHAIRAFLDPPPDPDPFTQPAHAATPPAAGTRPGDDWATRTSWDQILTPHGWRQVRDLGNGRRCWCRPGKTGPFTSATTRDDGGFYVFTTSTSFDPEIPYTKFGTLAVLEHGGDHHAAARALGAQGYGTPPAAPAVIAPAPGPGGSSGWWSEIAARHTPVDWHQLFDGTPEEEDWIIAPLLATGRSIALYSPPKAGKSLLALEIAAAVAAGHPVLGQPAGKLRKVLYVDLENSRRDIKNRLTGFGYKPDDLTNLIYLSFPSLPVLDSAQGGREIMALVLAHQVQAVVIDTVSRVIAGKENDADTFAALYRYTMAPLKGAGIAVLRLDHAGKDVTKGQRGSSAKNADVDAVWTLTAAGPVITLHCEMSRTPVEAQAVTLRREIKPLRHEVTARAAAVGKVQVMMAKLDELGVPRNEGRIRCQKALNMAGIPIDTNVLTEAIRTRKQQPNLTDDLETAQSGSGETAGQTCLRPRSQVASANGAGNLTDDLRNSQSGSSEMAGQTCLEDQQSGSVRSGAGDQPNLTGSGGLSRRETPGQSGLGTLPDDHEPICTSCGEHHNRYGPAGRPCYRPAPPALKAAP